MKKVCGLKVERIMISTLLFGVWGGAVETGFQLMDIRNEKKKDQDMKDYQDMKELRAAYDEGFRDGVDYANETMKQFDDMSEFEKKMREIKNRKYYEG